MAKNELSVEFIFNDRDGFKVDSLKKNFIEVNTEANSLKTDKSVNEFNKLENAGLNSLNRIKNATNEINGLPVKPSIEIPKKPLADLETLKYQTDEVKRKALEVQKSFGSIAKERLSSGNVSHLTKEIETARDRSKQLTDDIRQIKTELNKPNRKSSIAFLTEELRGAEKETESLNRKLSTLQSPDRLRAGQLSPKTTAQRRGITDFQRSALEIADDFAPAGTNRIFNAVAREILLLGTAETTLAASTTTATVATTAQTTANAAAGVTAAATTTAVEAETAAFFGLSYASLGVFAAAAAAGFAVISTSQTIREQSEKRLLNEQSIAGAISKQVLGLRDALTEYDKFEKRLSDNELFSNRIKSDVNSFDAGAVKKEQDRIRSENKSTITEINRLQADLAQKEKSLEYAKNRNVNQNLLTTLGIGNEYTAGQKQTDVAAAERAVEKTRKRIAENESALERGKGAFQQTNEALNDIRTKQNEVFNEKNEIFKKSQKDARDFDQSQIKSLKKSEDQITAIKLLKSEFNTFAAESASNKNPFVSLFAEADSAGERMEKRFKSLGSEYVKLATEIEKNNIAKKLNELKFESDKKALGFEQSAASVSRIRDTQFTSFERAISIVERKVDSALKINQLNRDISETDFYTRNYNRNNPKSFEENSRRFIGDDPSLRNALSDISALRNIDTASTGIYGQSAVAGEVLKVLPPLQDLVSALNNPKLASDAQYLLEQRSGALRTTRDAEKQKLNDFLYDQETAGLNRKFAYQQLDVLNRQTGLNAEQKAQGFLDVVKPLGNDIDPYLRRGLYENSQIAAQAERQKQERAERDQTERNRKIDGFLDIFSQIISRSGLKIDGSNLPPTQVFVDAKDFDISEENNPSRATNEDTGKLYGDYQNALN